MLGFHRTLSSQGLPLRGEVVTTKVDARHLESLEDGHRSPFELTSGRLASRLGL